MTNISFPHLGISLDVSKIALSLGPFTVTWYAIMILSGAILGTIFCAKTAKNHGSDSETVMDIALYGMIFGIIGARLYYVAFDWDSYKNTPLDILKIYEGGLAIYGGIIAALITVIVYCKIKKKPILCTMDVCAPGLLIGQAIGRYGNFFNCEVYGRETTSLLGMSIDGATPVHPLFFYESCWNILGFILLVLFRKNKKADGQIIVGYLIWYSLGRFFLEGLRQSEYILWLVKDTIAISQAVAILFIIIGIFIFFKLRRK